MAGSLANTTTDFIVDDITTVPVFSRRALFGSSSTEAVNRIIDWTIRACLSTPASSRYASFADACSAQ